MDVTEKGETSIRKKKKPEFEEQAQEAIRNAQKLSSKGKLDEAIETLLRVEKKARLGGDTASVWNCAQVVLRVCNDAGDYEKLNHYISLLCKRRGQSETVQTNLINYGAGFAKADTFKGSDQQREALIETLRKVSAGKMKVEVVRAELTQLLSRMKESEKKLQDAHDLLQEEAVETYAGMPFPQKMDYLLEQFRLCLSVSDYIRAKMVANKVDRTKLDRHEDLKVKFYRHLIEYYRHEREPLEMARAHLAIYKTPQYQSDETKWAAELQSTVVLLAVSAYDNLQVDLVHNLLADPKISQMPEYKSFLSHFVTDELAQWPLPEHDLIIKHELLAAGEAAAKKGDTKLDGEKTWYYGMLRDRVVEHDIRVVAKYYTRINTIRLAEMLQLSVDKTEDYLSSMVTSESTARLDARIDRPAGIISFQLRKNPNEHLTEWTDNISDLLNLVEKTCHLISKENMLYQIK